MPLKISAFPKCYLEDISNGKMSLFEWIEMAKSLDADGLELGNGRVLYADVRNRLDRRLVRIGSVDRRKRQLRERRDLHFDHRRPGLLVQPTQALSALIYVHRHLNVI